MVGRELLGKTENHIGFANSERKHVLLISNHGSHAPLINVTTDTGGQNFYVNSEAEALTKLGYKVTILNRGGYNHPVTGQPQRGIIYYNKVWPSRGKFCRIIYLEDSRKEFIRKEELTERNMAEETEFFFEIAEKISLTGEDIYFINSHYWDAGVLACMIRKEIEARKGISLPHVWTPHSLGILKRSNFEDAPKDILEKFNFPLRVSQENRIIEESNGVVATSNTIHRTLQEYGAKVKNSLWMPPGVKTEDFYPRRIDECSSAIALLSEAKGADETEIVNLLKTKVVFLEISRTARTKKKSVILKAFDEMRNKDHALLILNVDRESPIYGTIRKTLYGMKDRDGVIILDRRITDKEVAQLFALANVYVSASMMEGWGMSVQQAAASRCAIISSKHIPFVTEILEENALVVLKDDSRLYAEKMDIMVNEPNFRNFLAAKAYRISRDNSWKSLTAGLVVDMQKSGILSLE